MLSVVRGKAGYSARDLVISLAVISLGGTCLLVGCAGSMELNQAVVLEQRIAKLRTRSERQTDNAKVHRELAQALLEQGETVDAQIAAEVAWQLQPMEGKNLVVLGQVLLASGHRVRALRVLKQAAAVSPRDWRVGLLLGRVLGSQGQWQKAEKILRRAESYGGHHHELTIAIVEIMLLSGRLHQASVRLRDLPNTPITQVLRARLAHLYGRPTDALQILDEGLKKYSNNQCLLNERIDSLWRLARWSELAQAIADSTEKNNASSDNGTATTEHWLYQALLLQAEPSPAKLSQAQALLKERLLQKPQEIELRLVLARMQLQSHQPHLALETLELELGDSDFTNINVAIPLIRRMRTGAYLALGKLGLAQAELEQAKRLQPNHDYDRLLNIALLIQQNQKEEATVLLEQYLKKAPHQTQALLMKVDLATLHRESKQYSDTLDLISPFVAPQQVAFAKARQAYISLQYTRALKIIEQSKTELAQAELTVATWRWQVLKALALNALNKNNQAQKILKPLIQYPATSGWAARIAGDIHALKGQFKVAQQFYQRGLSVFPNQPLLLEGVSRVALAQGQKQVARIALEKGLAQVSPWKLIFLERLRTLNRPSSLQSTYQNLLTDVPAPPLGPLFLPPQFAIPWPQFFHSLQRDCTL